MLGSLFLDIKGYEDYNVPTLWLLLYFTTYFRLHWSRQIGLPWIKRHSQASQRPHRGRCTNDWACRFKVYGFRGLGSRGFAGLRLRGSWRGGVLHNEVARVYLDPLAVLPESDSISHVRIKPNPDVRTSLWIFLDHSICGSKS